MCSMWSILNILFCSYSPRWAVFDGVLPVASPQRSQLPVLCQVNTSHITAPTTPITKGFSLLTSFVLSSFFHLLPPFQWPLAKLKWLVVLYGYKRGEGVEMTSWVAIFNFPTTYCFIWVWNLSPLLSQSYDIMFCNCEFCNHTLFFYRKDAASRLPTLQWVPLLSTTDPPWSSALNRRHQQRPSLPREVSPLSREATGHCPTCWIPPPGVPWSQHGRAACRALTAPPPARWMLMTAAWTHSTPPPSK